METLDQARIRLFLYTILVMAIDGRDQEPSKMFLTQSWSDQNDFKLPYAVSLQLTCGLVKDTVLVQMRLTLGEMLLARFPSGSRKLAEYFH